jgi:DNA ligase D-like protein (predicted ligase)
MLATLADEPPDGDEWLHEIKYDGYRTQLVIEGTEVRAFTRNGFDWTNKYPAAVRAAHELRCSLAIVEGEMIVQDEHGRSDYHGFKAAMTRRPEALVFMAFDLLHLNGRDLRKEPLIERRLRLQQLVGRDDPGCRIQFSEHVVGNGAAMFAAADRMGLEGIVSKQVRSRYRSGRSPDWLKVKCFAEGQFVVIGTERGVGPTTALLAHEQDGELAYVGGAMLTLPDPQRERFWQEVERLQRGSPAVRIQAKWQASWVEPEMRVRVRYLKGSDKLRHATVLQVM